MRGRFTLRVEGKELLMGRHLTVKTDWNLAVSLHKSVKKRTTIQLNQELSSQDYQMTSFYTIKKLL